MSRVKLGLDEALVTVNKSLQVAAHEQVDVYYQLDECFGCPLERLQRLGAGRLEDFVASAKFGLQLEFRTNKSALCHLDGVQLNHHGHYKIDLSDCSLTTLDKGACALCPPLLLLSLLLLFTLAERLYSRRRQLLGGCQRDKKRPTSTTEATTTSESSESDSEVAEATVTTGNNVGEQVADGKLVALSGRAESLDVFRGVAITGMIAVNYGGAGYRWLEHAPWDGATPADLVFPFFVFAMGASIALSSRSAQAKNGETFMGGLQRAVKRALLLMALGLCLNSRALGAQRPLSELRLTGVLQRFSLSYLVVASLYLGELALNRWLEAQDSAKRWPLARQIGGALLCELLPALGLLSVYLWTSLCLDYEPGLCPPGYLGPGGLTAGGAHANCTGGAAAWLDRQLLGTAHLYQDRELAELFKAPRTHDPEGLLGLATSCLLTLAGLQCGKILANSAGRLRSQPEVVRSQLHRRRVGRLALWAFVAALGTLPALSGQLPINKRLWSPTFVALAASASFLLLALLYLLVDVRRLQRHSLALRLLQSAGQNPLALYVGHSLLDSLLPWHFAVDPSSHLQLLARLAWATLLWLLVAHHLARRRLFIKL